FVDKFIGDALLVVFGLFEQKGSADAGATAALSCAAAMRAELATLNADRARRGLPALAIAGTIHSGEVVAGTIGAQDRHEFTVVGDTVNVAARLQEIAKRKDWEFLASEATLQRAYRCGATPQTIESDAVPLRGRQEPVRVYRLS
ncbi:MAG TPA: adenylate/guanylate cyclase domain-containing protein, partial [Terriglobales bacterium]|nr:adenylate/guanylate cyclase domain-containing protein [Terriglobales bacterium]